MAVKYRAWDGSKYHYLFVINSETGEIIYNGQIKNDWILEQCTGLKPKGVEMYAGDIVRMNAQYPGSRYGSGEEKGDGFDIDYVGEVVITATKGACLKNPTCSDNENDRDTWKLGYYKPISACRSEIIGNIHENPELLDKKD